MSKQEFIKQLEEQGDLPVLPNVDDIIRYEGGEMNSNEIIEFFAPMIKSGVAYQLQGNYGRTANALIEHGYISVNGEILIDLDEL